MQSMSNSQVLDALTEVIRRTAQESYGHEVAELRAQITACREEQRLLQAQWEMGGPLGEMMTQLARLQARVAELERRRGRGTCDAA